MASYLDARAARGTWLIRMEDLDTPRMVPGADQVIINQLATLGMHADQAIVYQSQRLDVYQEAFDALSAQGLIYPCGCTRQEIADSLCAAQTQVSLTDATAQADQIAQTTQTAQVIPATQTFTPSSKPYPGTCRNGLAPHKTARAWRLKVPHQIIELIDRWCGQQTQNVHDEVGDFILRRADGIWSYQLAVVVDDAAQDVTHIVRGQDLLNSTARQRLLAQVLGFTPPQTLHVPVLYDERGLKYSKQNHAPSLNLAHPLECLTAAWLSLGFAPLSVRDMKSFWNDATLVWQNRFFNP